MTTLSGMATWIWRPFICIKNIEFRINSLLACNYHPGDHGHNVLLSYFSSKTTTRPSISHGYWVQHSGTLSPFLSFRTTLSSRKLIENQALAAEVRAAVVDLKPDDRVSVSDGKVVIKTSEIGANEAALEEDLRQILKTVPGVKHLEIDVSPQNIAD